MFDYELNLLAVCSMELIFIGRRKTYNDIIILNIHVWLNSCASYNTCLDKTQLFLYDLVS